MLTLIGIWVLIGLVAPIIVLVATRKKGFPYPAAIIIWGAALGPIPVVALAVLFAVSKFGKSETLDELCARAEKRMRESGL